MEQRHEAYLSSHTVKGRKLHDGVLASWSASMGDIPIEPTTPSDARDFIRKQAISGPFGKPIKPQTLKGMLQIITNLHTRVHESGNSFRAGLKLDLATIETTKLDIAQALGLKDFQ